MGRTRHFEIGLTPRQKEVLRLIEKGHTNGEIAEKLGISLAGAKWHVSELLSRFGVTSREDLAELMESERRGPVERARGWMAGLAGLMSLKAGGGVAAAGVAVAAGLGGVVVLGGERATQTPLPANIAAVLPDDPGDSMFSPAEAYMIAAAEAERQFEELNGYAGPGLTYELVEAYWLPSSTGYWYRGYGWKWQSANFEVHDLWAFRWELVDGSLLREDSHVTVLVSDGYAIPLGSLSTHEDRRTGELFTLDSGIATPPKPQPPPSTDQMLVALQNARSGMLALQRMVGGFSWCQGSGGISEVGPASVTAVCPVTLPAHELIRPYLHINATPEQSVTRTLHVAYLDPIVRLVVPLDTGGFVEIELPEAPTQGRTRTGWAIIPHRSLPTEVIGYDAAGNEVARREYPPRPARP